MLIASSFILNQSVHLDMVKRETLSRVVICILPYSTTSRRQFEFYPYLHSFSNRRSKEDLLKPSHLPDVLPSDLITSGGDFSFAAGDFLELYSDETGSTWLLYNSRKIIDWILLPSCRRNMGRGRNLFLFGHGAKYRVLPEANPRHPEAWRKVD